jgi:hypothetical protein
LAYLFARSERTEERLTFNLSLLAPAGGAALQAMPQDVDLADLDKLLASIDSNSFDVDAFGKKLAPLVLPPDVLEALANPSLRDCHLTVIHDREASRVPWETIRVGTGAKPPATALQGGLGRRYLASLPVARWLSQRREESTFHILLVVNPTGDLRGAEKEAQAVRGVIGDRLKVTELAGDDATHDRLWAEFGSGKYDAIHYAGHAFYDSVTPGNSGILAAGRVPLTGRDLADLQTLPALFFCNACESGRVRNKPPKPAAQRVEETTSFAEAFLVNGIAQFIGTYWPVGDDSAAAFATTFYQSVAGGAGVGDALLQARQTVAKLPDNSWDWADYMHYGDPRFVLKFPRGPSRP